MNESTFFSNQEISLAQLPQYQNVELQGLSPKYIYIRLVKSFIFLISALVINAILYYFMVDEYPYSLFVTVSTGLVIISIVNFVLYYYTFSRRGYALREKDLLYKRGILTETTSIIPLKNVKHINYSQGFWERKFDLASLECFTSGSGNSDLDINGLTKENAQKIQDYILKTIKEEIN